MTAQKKKPQSTTKFRSSTGHRSGLEDKIAANLQAAKVNYTYEELVINYIIPARKARYTPDFVIAAEDSATGKPLIIEGKGRWLTKDRHKALLIQDQHPDLDIRLVFSRSKSRISKGSSTTYAMWCEKYGFQYADETIPTSWLNEQKANPNV